MPHRDLFTSQKSVERMLDFLNFGSTITDPADRNKECAISHEYLDLLQRRFPGKAWCCGFITRDDMAYYVFYGSNGYLYCLCPGRHQAIPVFEALEQHYLCSLRMYIYRMTKDEIFFMIGSLCDLLSDNTSCVRFSEIICDIMHLYQSSQIPIRHSRRIPNILEVKKGTISLQTVISRIAQYVCGSFTVPNVVPLDETSFLATSTHFFEGQLFPFTERWTADGNALVIEEAASQTRASCISFIESITRLPVKQLKNQLPFVFYVEGAGLFSLVKQCGGKIQILHAKDRDLFAGQLTPERIEAAFAFIKTAVKEGTGALYTSWLMHMLLCPNYPFPCLRDILLFKRGDLPIESLVVGLDRIIHDSPELPVISRAIESSGFLVRHVKLNGATGFDEWHILDNNLLFRFTHFTEITEHERDQLSDADSLDNSYDRNEYSDVD